MKKLFFLSFLGGCLYLTPINQRPSLEIVNESSETIDRGQPDVTLTARVNDPEGHLVNLAWRMFVCDDASSVATCDDMPAEEGTGAAFVFTAPIARANGTPAMSLLI